MNKRQKIEAELFRVASEWRAKLFEIGTLMLKLESECKIPIRVYQEQVMRDRLGISLSSSTVAYRWARGDYGDADDAHLAVVKIRHSELAEMPASVVAAVVGGKHNIRADEGRVVTKTLSEMSKREASRNIARFGVIPIAAGVRTLPEFRSAIASRVEIEDGGNVVFVADHPEPIRIHVSRKRLMAALSLLKNDKDAA